MRQLIQTREEFPLPYRSPVGTHIENYMEMCCGIQYLLSVLMVVPYMFSVCLYMFPLSISMQYLSPFKFFKSRLTSMLLSFFLFFCFLFFFLTTLLFSCDPSSACVLSSLSFYPSLLSLLSISSVLSALQASLDQWEQVSLW